MKEYAIRFCGMLHMSDKAYDGQFFEQRELITLDTMDRALEIADYFFDSAKNVCERVSTSIIATPEVLRLATFVKAGYTYQQIGDREWPEKTPNARRIQASRTIKKMIKEYPKVFGAEIRT
jgi:hypothetical protein